MMMSGMHPQQMAFNIVMGCAFLALGLIPGPLWELKEGIQRFRDSLSPFSARTSRGLDLQPGHRLPGQTWLAAGGGLLILLSLFFYLAN
jgi:hypothetical protein